MSSKPKTPVTPTPTPQQANPWAFRPPTSTQELLRQLSANVGQDFMPYGLGGDVRLPAFGTPGSAQMNVDPAHYGETGGETNFFTTSTGGGMAPISAAPRAATDWNPLGLFPKAAASSSKKTDSSTNASLLAGLTSQQLQALINAIFPTE